MDPKQLFRQSAIDKVASPEQLDAQMEVTSPRGWIALGTTGLLICGTILWSIVGRIPDKASGQGVLLGEAGSLREIVATGSGEITELRIEQGDFVDEEEVVAVIELPGEEVRIDEVREQAEAAEREYEAVRLDNQAATNRYRNDIDNARAGISRTQEQLEAARQDLARIQELYERELATVNQVRQAESRISRLEGEVDRYESQVNRARDSIASLEARTRNAREQMLAAQRKLENAQRGVGVQSEVRSPVAGRIMQLLALANSTVNQGQAIARVAPDTGVPDDQRKADEPPTLNVTPIFAVPSDQAGMIEPGQPVEISPSGIRREEYGFLRGEVLRRAPLPEGAEDFAGRRGLPEGVARDLGSESVIEVEARLFPADTPSGFEWSAGTGPPYQIQPGTTINVEVRVRETAPIQLVIPTLRSWFGAS